MAKKKAEDAQAATEEASKETSTNPIPGARKEIMNEFRANYTRTHRAMEVSGITTFFIVSAIHMWNLHAVVNLGNILVLFVAVVLSMITADFLSGMVHWFADTWGSVDWPLIGRSLLRSFREHHVDPGEITRHDFIETNGDSSLISLPVYTLILLVDPSLSNKHFFWYCFVVSLGIWVLFTNQFHKWAHADSLPLIARILMKYKIILNSRVHYVHHRRPFDTYYCITTGWLNRPLSAINFWKRMEWVVTKLTGAVPRADDYYYARKYLKIAEGYQWK